MKIMHVMAALLLISSLATPSTAKERISKSGERAQAHRIEGREVAAPPWSAACMTDHAPSECVSRCGSMAPAMQSRDTEMRSECSRLAP